MTHTGTPHHQRFESHAQVLECCSMNNGVHRLMLDARDIASQAQPGQFIMIGVNPGYEPLLRRPMSLLDADAKRGSISMLFRVVGEGTGLMAQFREGERHPVVGPLGRGFTIDGDYTEAILVGGGMGIPPLVYLTSALRAAGKQAHFLYGARSSREVFLTDRLQHPLIRLDVATDDGSAGHHGFVTELLERALQERGDAGGIRVFACGPGGMLAQVMRISKERGLDAELSLETLMPCGLGLCQGCAIPVAGSNGREFEYKLVCRDGPVFHINELLPERLMQLML